MLSRFRPRLTYANVVSSIALFAVLGGGAYAHHRNSVGPQQIKKDAVNKRHIDRNAVATKELRPRSVRPGIVAPNAIRTRHLFDGVVTADKLAPGVAVSGPQGLPGPQGQQGPQGNPGADGTSVAYGHITSTGTVQSPATRSKNLTNANIVKGGTGLYCFENVPARTLQAASQFSAHIVAVQATPESNTNVSGCPGTAANTVGAVRTFNAAGAAEDTAFLVLFDE